MSVRWLDVGRGGDAIPKKDDLKKLNVNCREPAERRLFSCCNDEQSGSSSGGMLIFMFEEK